MQVLDSISRTPVCRQTRYDTTDFDEAKLGLPWEPVMMRQADVQANTRNTVYDAQSWSQSNRSHTYGDHSTDTERQTVFDYLKTL